MRPLDLSPRSSDEYEPVPPSPVVAEAARHAQDALHELLRRGAVSRRELFMSAAASAAVLSALAACSSEERASRGGTTTGGTFVVPTDPAAASTVLDNEGFVVDVQLHFLDPERNTANFGASFPQASCGATDARLCFTQDRFLDLVFAQSDTAHRGALGSAVRGH